MSEPIKDGGPAFPEAIAIGPAGDVYPGMSGMTLRDYFAAAALTGLAASMPSARFELIYQKTQGGMKEAVTAYQLADAMIAAREAKP